MTHRVSGMVLAILLLAGVTPGWSQQQYLYAPRPVAAGETVRKSDGVLVQEVSVKKGDTLSALSRTFSGRGSYYPQILLFNDIKNPDRIYTGDVLRVPVSRRAVTGQTVKTPLQGQAAAATEKKRARKHTAAAPAGTHARGASQQPAGAVAASAEQRLFERAIKAYRQDNYRTALQLFERFLAAYPASALAADASLYKAECYLKQSGR